MHRTSDAASGGGPTEQGSGDPLRRSRRPSPDGTTVSVRGLSKSFRIPHHQVTTLKERAIHPLRRTGYETRHVLRGLDLEIGRGELFAVIGRNGSGKSTLLKCIAGIYQPDAGEVRIEGRLSPFIELGVGFDPNLAARDNVVINATLIGLSPAEARRRFDEIIAFAELEEFVDLQLKNYSSGMQVRLAFSTAIQVDADVLLVDEVLAVGDALFQQKCIEAFQRLREEGKTIVYVSHDLGTVEAMADRALLIEDGRPELLGDPVEAIRAYEALNRARQAEGPDREPGERYGDGRAEVTDATLLGPTGEPAELVAHGSTLTLRIRVRFHRDIEGPLIGFAVRDTEERLVMTTDSRRHVEGFARARAGEERELRVELPAWLTAGHYTVTAFAGADGTPPRWADVRERLLFFEVEAPYRAGGVMHPPWRLELEP